MRCFSGEVERRDVSALAATSSHQQAAPTDRLYQPLAGTEGFHAFLAC